MSKIKIFKKKKKKKKKFFFFLFYNFKIIFLNL